MAKQEKILNIFHFKIQTFKKNIFGLKKIFRTILIILSVLLFISNEPEAFLNVFRIGLDLFLNRKVRADSKRHQIGTNSQYDITLPFIPK